jgi:hypothetical protein
MMVYCIAARLDSSLHIEDSTKILICIDKKINH